MPKHRRRVVLINRSFQIRFALYMVGWLVALCFVYPLVVDNIFDYFIRYLARDPMGPELEGLMKTKSNVLLLLGLSEVVFIALTLLAAIFISHRVAGPLYKLRMTFASLAEGKFVPPLRFRQKDYFPELAESFNEMAARLAAKDQSAAQKIEAVLSGPGGASLPPEAKKNLEEAVTLLRGEREQG